MLIEEQSSLYNPNLYVVLKKGRLQLCTQAAIYSYADKYDNFRDAFDAIRISDKKIQKVLLLGLGLGSIPYMLEKIYGCLFDYTAIEIDPVICQLAEKYVLSDLDSMIQIYPIDALDYFQWNVEKFDLIAMDIFQSATIPTQFESVEFMHRLKNTLNPEGILLFNRLDDDLSNQERNKQFLTDWMKVFSTGQYIQTRNNHVYINDSKHMDD